MQDNGRALVEAIFRQAQERQREEERRGREIVEEMHRQAHEEYRRNPPPPPPPPKGVHYTELREAQPGEPLADERNTYRREVGRLLAEGQEGKFALIKGTNIVGLFDTCEAARGVGLKQWLLQPFLVQQILTEEPYLRMRGLNFPLPTRLRAAS